MSVGLVEDFISDMDGLGQDLLEDFMLVIDDGIEIAQADEQHPCSGAGVQGPPRFFLPGAGFPSAVCAAGCPPRAGGGSQNSALQATIKLVRPTLPIRRRQ